MHLLNLNETQQVAGGGDIADAVQVAAAIGGVAGAAYAAAAGGTGTTILAAAGLGATLFSGYTAVGLVAWNVGSAIYEAPGVSEFIADTIDSIFMPEPVGTVGVGPLTPSMDPFPTVGYNDEGIYYRDVPVSDPYGGN